jgi:hypothetical protein
MSHAANQENFPHLRWNYRMFILNGVAFRVVDTLFSPTLVMVVFLAHLTDNPIILGMPAALWLGGFSFTQLWASGRVQRLRLALPPYREASLIRAGLLLLLVAVTAFSRDPTLLITVFLLFLLVYPLVGGVAGLVFMEMMGKLIPPRSRGPMLSWRMSLGGILALGASGFVNRVVGPDFMVGFPLNFALIFAAATVATIAGILPFHLLREPEAEPRPPEHGGLRGRWTDIKRIWREDPPYRCYIVAQVIRLLATGTAPLIIIYAQRRFDLPLSAAALFLMADTVTGLVVVAASGWLSVRLGNCWLVVAGSILGVVLFVMIVLAGPLNLSGDVVMLYFLVIFILLAAHNATINVGTWALGLNLAPVGERPLYIGLAAVTSGLAYYVSAAQGAMIDVIGYEGLFLLAALLMACSLWQVTRLHDPTGGSGV